MLEYGKIESLREAFVESFPKIEARRSSVAVRRTRQSRTGKGIAAEAGNAPEHFPLGRQRRSAGLSQIACGALSMAVRDQPSCYGSDHAQSWTAYRAVQFFYQFEK